MRPSFSSLSPLRRTLFTAQPRTVLASRASIAVAAATGVTLTYLCLPYDRRIALDAGGAPARRSRSIWDDEPPAKPQSTPTPSDEESTATETDSEGALDNSAAFNPETGEINWDCSCLGGMAHGPCGPEFREAFSCFIYSDKEPKGVDCVEKFKGMQDCFREHPDVYGEEIDDNDDAELEQEGGAEPATVTASVAKDPKLDVPPSPFAPDDSHPTTPSTPATS